MTTLTEPDLLELVHLEPCCDAGRVTCHCAGCRSVRGHGEPCARPAEWTGRAECAFGHVIAVLSCDPHRVMAQSGGQRRLCPSCWYGAGRKILQVIEWERL
jgi:hypothetical protein